MATANNPYVARTAEGGWRITGTRISLDSVVKAYWEGLSPEAIVDEWSTLTLEQVHGAIAFYLGNRDAIDRYLSDQDAAWEKLRKESEATHGPLLQRVRTSGGVKPQQGRNV
jgi:uncharacterized protein (DUF433 family)